MTKTFKKIAASVMAVATLAVGAAGMTASAAAYGFNLGFAGSSFTSAVKANASSYAPVTVSSNTLNSLKYAYFSLYDELNTTQNSGSVKFTSDETKNLRYYVRPSAGTRVYLHCNAGYEGCNVSGTWTP